ncbi:hypothetical protein, partial [Pseudomonas sp. GM18]|uniref:hypothetical protein n=1 Tax=Pseudomonas sp. GM18 TaxID=1144324 RepID=UPI001EE67BE7
MHRKVWLDDCCAAERSLAGSTAATDALRGLRRFYRALFSHNGANHYPAGQHQGSMAEADFSYPSHR